MENINGGSRASFRWMLSCATIGLVVSISPCFAQGNRDASQEMQRLGTAPPEMMTPFKCDSLDPKVCFDIYRRRIEQRSGGVLYNEYPLGKALVGHRLDEFIKEFDQPKDWNTAIDVRFKSSGLIGPPKTFDAPKDWFTLPLPNPKDLTRIK
jgi:hypothetical protein